MKPAKSLKKAENFSMMFDFICDFISYLLHINRHGKLLPVVLTTDCFNAVVTLTSKKLRSKISSG